MEVQRQAEGFLKQNPLQKERVSAQPEQIHAKNNDGVGNRILSINLLKPRGYCTYHIVHSKILNGSHIALCVLYRSQNKQRLLPNETPT